MSAAGGGIVGALGGALVGVALVAGIWLGWIPIEPQLVFTVGAPGAHLVSMLSGWPLEQEAALACYALGFAITPPIVLALLGGTAAALFRSDRAA